MKEYKNENQIIKLQTFSKLLELQLQSLISKLPLGLCRLRWNMVFVRSTLMEYNCPEMII